MAQNPPQTTTPLKVRRFDSEEIFLMLNHPLRRRIILALARGELKTAMEANSASGARRENYLKQFALLCQAGILVKKENRKNRRQPLFGLSPGVVVCDSPEAITVDFGGCGIRLSKTLKSADGKISPS